MKNAFAAKTVVQVSKSKAEIEHLLFARPSLRLESDHSKGYAWARLQIGPPHSFLALTAIQPPFGPFHVLSIQIAGLIFTLSVNLIRVKNV